MMVPPGAGRSRPNTVFGKFNGSWISQIASCSSGGRIRQGSPTAIQPIGTVALGGSEVLRCTTLLMRASAPVPTRAPVKTELRSEEHTSELQSRENLVCRLLLEK